MTNSLGEELEERISRILREHRAESCEGVECCSRALIRELRLGVEAQFTTSNSDRLGYRLKKQIVGEL